MNIIEHNARTVRFFAAVKRDRDAKPLSAEQVAEFTTVFGCEREERSREAILEGGEHVRVRQR